MTSARQLIARGLPLRGRLVSLIAAALLPLAVMAGLSLDALRTQQRRQVEQVGLELARSVANAVDAGLRSEVASLQTLATAASLDRDNLPEFLARTRRVLAERPQWAGVLLQDASGRDLLDSRTPAGPPLADPESFDRVVRARAPAVGNLISLPGNGWTFLVRVPVMREGAVQYVVTALVDPDAVLDVVNRQQVPADWIISIMDAKGRRAARSRAHQETLGGRLSESAAQLVARGDAEGVGVSTTLEGDEIFTPFSRVRVSGWMAVLGIPTALVEAGANRSVAIYGGGILLSILLGTLGALWVSRTITRPISSLRTAAEALGRRQVPQVPATAIHEIASVGAALKDAAEALARGEMEREDLLRSERLARTAAEHADRVKDEFLAVVSHELRTPLSAVSGWARMLQSGQIRDEPTMARAMDAIVRNADVQVQLIDDLLDLSRITTGKMRLDVRRIDVRTVLQASLDAVRPAAEAKAIRLQSVIEPDAGLVMADPGRLQQIVWNLLANAVKFTPQGGDVRLQVARDDGYVRLTISDTGLGIAPELLPRIFDRFRQADGSSTRNFGGLGLGLALAKQLVELHGGHISAQSDGLGRGATFVVTLPSGARASMSDAGAATPVATPARVPTRRGRLDGMRVLVTDDDSEGLSLAETILMSSGAEVRTCRSAAAALQLVRQWHPDVLVSDIGMPDEDGYTLIRNVRALDAEHGGDIPAVALTAYGRVQDRMRCLEAGFNLHIAKPVDPDALTALVAELPARARGPANDSGVEGR